MNNILKTSLAVITALSLTMPATHTVTAKTNKTYLTPSSLTMTVGSKKKLTLKNNKQKVTWASSKYMSLSNKTRTGVLVKAKKKGSGTVTAKLEQRSIPVKSLLKIKRGHQSCQQSPKQSI